MDLAIGIQPLGSADAGASIGIHGCCCRITPFKSPPQPLAALLARHASTGCHQQYTSTVLTHPACMTSAPGWVQRREELRQRLQLDKVLAPELEAQAAERDALAAQQQVRVLGGAPFRGYTTSLFACWRVCLHSWRASAQDSLTAQQHVTLQCGAQFQGLWSTVNTPRLLVSAVLELRSKVVEHGSAVAPQRVKC